VFRCHSAVYIDSFVCLVKLINLCFFVCLLSDFHSGEIKISKYSIKEKKHNLTNNKLHQSNYSATSYYTSAINCDSNLASLLTTVTLGKSKFETSGYATWFTVGGAIRIAHYDVIDDVITRKL